MLEYESGERKLAAIKTTKAEKILLMLMPLSMKDSCMIFEREYLQAAIKARKSPRIGLLSCSEGPFSLSEIINNSKPQTAIAAPK